MTNRRTFLGMLAAAPAAACANASAVNIPPFVVAHIPLPDGRKLPVTATGFTGCRPTFKVEAGRLYFDQGAGAGWGLLMDCRPFGAVLA